MKKRKHASPNDQDHNIQQVHLRNNLDHSCAAPWAEMSCSKRRADPTYHQEIEISKSAWSLERRPSLTPNHLHLPVRGERRPGSCLHNLCLVSFFWTNLQNAFSGSIWLFARSAKKGNRKIDKHREETKRQRGRQRRRGGRGSKKQRAERWLTERMSGVCVWSQDCLSKNKHRQILQWGCESHTTTHTDTHTNTLSGPYSGTDPSLFHSIDFVGPAHRAPGVWSHGNGFIWFTRWLIRHPFFDCDVSQHWL